MSVAAPLEIGGGVVAWSCRLMSARVVSPPEPTEEHAVTSIEPELWVDQGAAAVEFYQAAFGASVLHQVGEGEDIVAQLAVGDAVFWVAAAGSAPERLTPLSAKGATGRTLLVVDEPETVMVDAVRAGATEAAPVDDQHGWRLGRFVDPFGHEWEIGRPLGSWPPD